MTILAIFTGNISKSQYDAVRKELNWEKHPPQGAILHAASFDDSGHVHVADIWVSAEAMGAYVEQRIAPTMQKLQISPPDVAVYPVHNINAYEAIEAYKV